MITPVLPSRQRDDVDALVTDRYLDALLAAGDRRAADAPADADLGPDVRAAAIVLRHAMVRVHPSFRFEERLAERIAGMASQARRVAVAGGAGGMIVAFPGAAGATGQTRATNRTGAMSAAGADCAGPVADPLLDAILRGDLDPSDAAAMARADRPPGARRPLIVGGAITSAAISLVGVAWVAWRASHPADGTTDRAVRSAHSRRGTAVALPGSGLGGPT